MQFLSKGYAPPATEAERSVNLLRSLKSMALPTICLNAPQPGLQRTPHVRKANCGENGAWTQRSCLRTPRSCRRCRSGRRESHKGNRQKHPRGFILKTKLAQPSGTSSTVPAIPERPEVFDSGVTVTRLFFLVVAKQSGHSVCAPIDVQDTMLSPSASSRLELCFSPALNLWYYLPGSTRTVAWQSA